MKNLLFALVAVVALSGGMFADTVVSTGTVAGSFQLFPTGFASSTPTWISNAQNPGQGTPFWNNASDATGLGAGQSTSHENNIGYLLTDTGGYTGTTSVIGSDTVSEDFTGASGVDPTAFNFVSNATAYNITLLFAEASFNTGSDPGTPADGVVGSVFGYYTGATFTPIFDVGETFGPTGTQTFNQGVSGTNYGFYDYVCYTAVGSTCTSYEMYTTGNGDTGNQAFLGADWNHFAVFQLASGAYVIGFSGQNGMYGENIGDFKDTVVELSLVAPEPGTIGFLGLGLACLGLLGRRRFAKK